MRRWRHNRHKRPLARWAIRAFSTSIRALPEDPVVMPLVLRWRRWIRSGGGYGSESRIIRLFRDSPLRSHSSKDLRVRSGLIRFCAEAAAGEYVFKHTHNQQLVPLLRFLVLFVGYDTTWPPPSSTTSLRRSRSRDETHPETRSICYD